MGSESVAAASPVSIGPQSPSTAKGTNKAPTRTEVDDAVVKIILMASVLYLWWLTRPLDPDLRAAARDDDQYVLTDEEAAAMGPAVRRLLAMVPGGQGAAAAVNMAEHLSIVFVLMAYAERTAPLRAEARNAAPARLMRPSGRRPLGRARGTANVAAEQNGPSTGLDAPAGPSIAPGVIGSQY